MAQRQSCQKREEKENPSKARAVINTLMVVTFPVVSLWLSLSENKLEMMVFPAMIRDRIPAYDTGTFNKTCMAGQAVPKRESGRPKLMNAI